MIEGAKTVRQLKEALEDLPDEMLVMIPTENGEYGSTYLREISEQSITLDGADGLPYVDDVTGEEKYFDVVLLSDGDN